ncbi:MAG: carboxypeptidase regulatory-like domain-containing protein [Gemmatimonadota bacterium]
MRHVALFAVFSGLAAPSLAAQSLTAGGLVATVTDDRGTPLRGVSVTIEHRGTAFRILETDRAGQVNLRSIPVGHYNILAEQLGFQPIRAIDAAVVTGALTSVRFTLVRRPPPINSVTEQPANATITATTSGNALDADALRAFDRRRDLTDASRSFSTVDPPRDGRDGFVASAGGLGPRFSRLMVDGVEETLLRHPGLPGDAASAPLWSRDGIAQALVSFFPQDVEFRPAGGALLSATSARGDGRFRFHPYAAFSGAKLGGASADNPADSSATSLEAGLAMSGALKGDTATWFLRADYRQLEQPSADPLVAGTGDPIASLLTVAQTVGGRDVSAWLSPTVRSWKGGSALGRVDFRVGKSADISVRGGGASWTEENLQAGTEAVNGAGSKLAASDFSSSAALTLTGDDWVSESRVGVRSSKRDWTGASLPFTGIVNSGFAFGGASTLPGNFKESAFELNEAITFLSGKHTFKVGGNAQSRKSTYDWMPGSGGRYDFGSAADFAAGRGSYYQALRATAAPQISVTTLSLFVEDNWRASSRLQLSAGFRFQKSALPTDLIGESKIWGDASGLNNQLVPVRQKVVGPRGGFTLALDAANRTSLRGEAGLLPGQHDITTFAEVVQFDGDVSVRRATGALAWPKTGEPSAAPFVGPSIAFYGPDVRAPRTFKGELGLTHDLGGGTSFSITGGYGHTDYLLRREDINRSVAPLSTNSDGRSIWGTLEQYGALLTPTVGSNHRFREIDFAYGISSTGYSDYYAATLGFEHRVSRGLQLMASYTYSKTQDNVVGQLSADPADRLSPFADGRGAANWDAGRSDLDIPHRLVATAEYRSTGTNPIALSARYRFRSGLPFTPGFQRGVDANGDGATGNDPAFLGSSIAGMSELAGRESCLSGAGFAKRNSCREKGVHGLDLRAEVGLPVGGARRVALTLDGFNVIATETGLVDHAAVLVNPTGTISTDGTGHTVLPLLANTNFGKLLVRRGEGRLLRVGIRVEN